MKEITIDQFISCIEGYLEIIIDSKSIIRLYESEQGICVRMEGDYIIGGLPKDESKYSYLYEKIKESFEGKYEIDTVSQHDFSGRYGLLMPIGRVILDFDYDSEEGQDWLYENF